MGTPHPRGRGGSAHGKQISPRRVRDLLDAAIREGILVADDILSEDALIAIFDASRGSVRTALNDLRERGVIERRPRYGTKVNAIGMDIPLADIPPILENVSIEVSEDRIVPSFRLLTERLRVDVTELRMVETVFTADTEVVGVRTAYFSRPLDKDPRTLNGPMLMRETLESFFEEEAGPIDVALSVARADSRTARLLGVVEGEALLMRDSIYYSAAGRPLQVSFDHLRPDRVRLLATVSHF